MTTTKTKLLLLTAQPLFAQKLRSHFSLQYQLETASSPQMADFLIQEWEPQLCLVHDSDDFLNWLSKLRHSQKDTRLGVICFGDSPGAQEEKSFQCGGDHWTHIHEPLDRVAWRIQALLRPLQPNRSEFPRPTLVPQSPEIHLDQLTIYPQDFLIKRDDSVLTISPTQFRLLSSFLSHQDQLLSREWIKKEVWPDSDISLRSIDAHISKLRKALPELDPYLMNIYGKGYVFSRSRKQEAA